MIRAILIDPEDRRVEWVNIPQSYEAIEALIGDRFWVHTLLIGAGFAKESVFHRESNVPGYSDFTIDKIACTGPAVVLCIGLYGVPEDPTCALADVSDKITWTDRRQAPWPFPTGKT